MSFYVILPSNTAIDGNKTSSFRVRLPRKLEFRSDWSVGLACFVYPHTWPALGASGKDEHIRMLWRNGVRTEALLPPSNLSKSKELEARLNTALTQSSMEAIGRLRSLVEKVGPARAAIVAHVNNLIENSIEKGNRLDSNKTVADDETTWELYSEDDRVSLFNRELPKHFTEDERQLIYGCARDPNNFADPVEIQSWIDNGFSHNGSTVCNFIYSEDTQRFSVIYDPKWVRSIELSEQLAYILGFTERKIDKIGRDYITYNAKFMPDLSGGVSTLYVYAPGLIEPVIVGDTNTQLLRVVIVRGQSGEIIEDNFVGIQYHKLLVKEVSDIQIEICSAVGNPMPFQYGYCILTLHFKKTPYF